MFTVFAKHFIYGTYVQDNVTLKETHEIMMRWNAGEDIMIDDKVIPNKWIESIRFVKRS